MNPRSIYILYSVLSSLAFSLTATVYVPYLEAIGFTKAQVMIVNALFWIICVFSEVPTGLIADRHGRAWSLRAGALCALCATVGFIFVKNLPMVLLFESIAGIGMAFQSGANTAWLKDALDREGKNQSFAEVSSAAQLYASLTAIAGGFLGTAIGAASFRYAFALEACCYLAVLFLITRYFRGHGESIPDATQPERLSEIQLLKNSVRALRKSYGLRWAMAMAAVSGLILPFNLGWSITVRARFGHHALGWVWAWFFVCIAIASRLMQAPGIVRRREAALWCSYLLLDGTALLILSQRLDGWSFFIAVTLTEIGYGIQGVVGETYVQHRIESAYRATYGSLQSLVRRLGCASVLAVSAFYLRERNGIADMQRVWLWCGLGFLLACICLWMWRPRGKEEHA